MVAEELAPGDGETETERAARIDAVIANRVPDLRFLLDNLLGCGAGTTPIGAERNGAEDIELDAARIGLVGHSFGGWTVLATPEVEPRARAVVALGPGGSAHPRPGRTRRARSRGDRAPAITISSSRRGFQAVLM